MENLKFAVFIDLENAGKNQTLLNNIINKIKQRGSILIAKAYGYDDSYKGINDFLKSNNFTVFASIKHTGTNKNNADIDLALEALQIAYENKAIDSFCIVSGDSDYIPLVRRLKAMDKYIIGMSRSEVASEALKDACDEFEYLEITAKNKDKERNLDSREAVNNIISDMLDSRTEAMSISELKNIMLRLKSDFNEKSYGYNQFSKFIASLAEEYKTINMFQMNNNYYVEYSDKGPNTYKITTDNYVGIFKAIFKNLKQDGFKQVVPSVLKGIILNYDKDFVEKDLGFKKFNDLLKDLEAKKLIEVKVNNSGNLVRLK